MNRNFRQDEDGQEFLQGLIEPDKDILPEDVSLISYGEDNGDIKNDRKMARKFKSLSN